MARDFADKSAARQWVWDRLSAEGVARFPFPPHGRIPNFAGAEVAAARLLNIEPWKSVTPIKVNPDSPQRPLRAEALRRGITVFVPTPRLRGGGRGALWPQQLSDGDEDGSRKCEAVRHRLSSPGSCYSERITFQLRTSCSPPPALLTTGLPSVKYASSIASAHSAAIAFSRSASKSGRGV